MPLLPPLTITVWPAMRDRQALLDALAARGFALLGQAIRQAIATGGDRPDRFTAAAKAYVGFALDNPALLELMFASKADQENEAIATAAADVFALTAEVMGESPEDATAMTASPLRLVVAATLQGNRQPRRGWAYSARRD